MDMKQGRHATVLIILVALSFFGCQGDASKQERPNIILINVDDMGWKGGGLGRKQQGIASHGAIRP